MSELSPLHSKLNFHKLPATRKMQTTPRRDSCPSIDPQMVFKKKMHTKIDDGLAEIQNKTSFGKVELQEIFEKYESITKEGKMDKESFTLVMKELLNEENEEVLDRYYKAFDSDENSNIDFKEFVLGLSILLKGDLETKVKFLFTCFDVDGSGFIEKNEMIKWMTIVFGTGVKLFEDIASSLDIAMSSIHMNESKIAKESIEQIADKCFEAADGNNDGRISLAEFTAWISKQPSITKWLCPSSMTENQNH